MRLGWTSVALAAFVLSFPVAPRAEEEPPLLALARQVPADARLPVYLVFPGAVLDEVARMQPFRSVDWVDAFSPLFFDGLVSPFSFQIVGQDNGFGIAGFALTTIQGLAGWGRPPNLASVILLGPDADMPRLDRFLADRGYDLDSTGRVPVRHLRRDFQIELGDRNRDIFVGSTGSSVRLAVEDGFALATRSWAMMDAALADREGQAASASRWALLSAIQDAGHGAPVQVILFGPQEPGGGDVTDPFPEFVEHALVEWMRDGAHHTALAFAFNRPEAVPVTEAWFAAMPDSGLPTPLAAMRQNGVLHKATVGDHTIVFWTLSEPIVLGDGRGGLRSSRSFMALVSAWLRRDLATVFGAPG